MSARESRFAAPDGDWRESEAVKQARTWLAQMTDPLWPGYTESDWADLLRAVLAERDFIGEWLQRCLDAENTELLPPLDLFPPGCTCSSYGHGLTMTRVNSSSCPVHGEHHQ